MSSITPSFQLDHKNLNGKRNIITFATHQKSESKHKKNTITHPNEGNPGEGASDDEKVWPMLIGFG